jgi:peptidoglycan/LPS O-acetylase OafA/YrhL
MLPLHLLHFRNNQKHFKKRAYFTDTLPKKFSGGVHMVPFIDRMRGALAILVALSHAAALASLVPAKSDAFQAALTPAIMFSGFNYVIGFIVISGYCVARSTIKSTIAQPFSLAHYAAMRITRIYPALIACAVLAGLVELVLFKSANRIPMWQAGIDARHFISNLLGLSGFAGQFGSYAPTYTVAYELFYYAIWGVALALLPQNIGCLAVMTVMPSLFFVLPGNFEFAIVLSALWIMGAALATYEDAIVRVVGRYPLWLVWSVCLIIFIRGNSEFAKQQISLWEFPGSLCTIPCGLLFAVVIASHLARSGPRLALDRWLGEISYPLFLAHGPVIIAVGSFLKALGLSMSFGVLMLILMSSSLVAAHAVVVLIERPVMSWRRSLRSEEAPPVAPAFARALADEEALVAASQANRD